MDTDPAINPATMETRPSTLLYPMVKYSSRWPRRTRSWRFGVVAVATSPLSPERSGGAKIRHLILDEGERSMKEMLSGQAASVGVILPDRSIPYSLADTIAEVSEGAWRLLHLAGDPPLTCHAAMVMARHKSQERTRVSTANHRGGGIGRPKKMNTSLEGESGLTRTISPAPSLAAPGVSRNARGIGATPWGTKAAARRGHVGPRRAGGAHCDQRSHPANRARPKPNRPVRADRYR